MKILFLHLSDIHADSQTNMLHYKTEKILSALNSVGDSEDCIIICSGDLASSGNENEYKSIRIFLGNLQAEIGKRYDKFIQLIVVPGNHDMHLPQDARTCKDILQYYDQDLDTHYNDELSMFDSFMKYAKSKHCFKNNPVYDNCFYSVGKYIIQITMLNTAPYSTLKKDNKELHYLPDEAIMALTKKETAMLSVAVMHHSPEWFHSRSKINLQAALMRNTDLVFQGHEHDLDSTIYSDTKHSIHVVKGGEYSGKLSHQSAFSTILLDTDKNEYEEKFFFWDNKDCLFVCTNTRTIQFVTKRTRLYPNIGYMNKLQEDKQGLAAKSSDYFVFPELKPEFQEAEEKDRIINEQEFLDIVQKDQFINIVSRTRGGKTNLLKYLFYKLAEIGYLPLYLGSEDYHQKRLQSLLQDLFSEQYSGDASDYSKYSQYPKDIKVVLIDDLDCLKQNQSSEQLLDFLSEHVGHVIFSSKDRFNPDIIESVRKKIKTNNSISTYAILDFYKSKRSQLVRKVCEISPKFSAEEIDDLIITIDKLATKRNSLFNLSPEFIVLYLKHFINTDPKERKEEISFNIIFETNIRESIIGNARKIDVQEYITLLEEIAFHMHFNKLERMNSSDIEALVNDYCKEHWLKTDIAEFIKSVTQAKILRLSGGSLSYEFTSRNHLAYFVAKRINRLIEKYGSAEKELSYILRNICFNINDNILLFLSYLRDNTRFALSLCDQAELLLKEYEELSFDKNNISFFRKGIPTRVCLPTPKEQKDYEARTEKLEEMNRRIDDETIKYKGLYDYSEEDIDKTRFRLARAVKYLEMIGKSLISQFSVLDANEKRRMVTCLYTLPNRALYANFESIDRCYEEVINELVALQDEIINGRIERGIKDNETLSREELEQLLHRCAIALCLSLYDDIAYCSANAKTLPIFAELVENNTNQQIQYLLMEENGNTTQCFVDEAIRLLKSSNDELLNNMIRLVARKHIMTRPSMPHSIRDQIADTIFSSSTARKQLLVISQKGTQKK